MAATCRACAGYWEPALAKLPDAMRREPHGCGDQRQTPEKSGAASEGGGF